MKLYIVRHGQTEWNVLRRAQGRADIPLNEVGLKQAAELREKIKDLEFDICFSSPLTRARKTAETIVDGRCEIVENELLLERNFGALEGATPDQWPQLGSDIDIRANLKFAEGFETIQELLERSKKFLDFLKTAEPDAAKVLVVSHGSFLRALQANIMGYDEDTDLHGLGLDNCELKEFEI